MSHPAFSSGQPPGMTGSAGGTGSALLPNITAELRGEFYPLLSTLASCESDISATYVMELFFTLVRLDAVLKAEERQLFVSTAQQLITRLLQQLQRVHRMRQLIDENERFVGELVERCAALGRLCSARDGDGDCHTNDGEDADDLDVSGQALPAPQVEDDVVDGHGDGEETVCSVATTRAAGTAATRLRTSPPAAHAGSTIVGPELRRFSFDDSLDEIENRAWTVQQSQQQQLRDRSGGSVRSTSAETTEGGGTTTSPSTSFSLRQWLLQRPPPLQWQNSGPRTASRRQHIGHTHSGAATPRMHGIITSPGQATGKTFDEDRARAETTSGSFAEAAAPIDVTPAVYMGVQLALQEHFRNNVRHTLTGSTLAVPRNLNELVQQQQPRGITTRPSSHSSERVSTDGGVAEADMDLAPQQQSLALNPSLVSSPGVAQHPFLSSYAISPPNANTSIFSLAGAPSAASTSNALGTDAGGSHGLKMGSGFSALHSPTTQDPVDTARVWDRTFWRFLGGLTATGDLAVLLTLLNTENPAQTQSTAALNAATSGVSAGYKGSFGTGRGGASTKSGMTSNAAAAAATDAAGVPGKSLAASPHTPKCEVQLLMEALKRSGTYSHLLPAASTFQVLSNSIASGAGTAGGARFADETASGRVATKGEREMLDDEVEHQQHAHGTPLSPEAQNPAPVGSVWSTGSRMHNNGCTVLLSLDDLAREEEVRLHRDFWTHIPAILATLTEGVMYGGSHGAAHSHKGSGSAPSEAGTGRGEVASLRDHHGSSDCWNSAPRHGATNESGRADEALQDLAASVGVVASAAGDGEDENVLAALHLPSVEALQLLPTFCPFLHNYTGAVAWLIRSAPEYARSTQAQHARALAVVSAAAAQQQQQRQAALSPNANDATGIGGECPGECEHSATASTSSASAPLSNARAGLTRTAAQRFSVAHMQELKDSHTSLSGSDRRPGGAAAAAAATGRTSNANSPAPAEVVEHGLLAAGSRTEVRAVDVVVHALVNAIHVQCVMAVAMQQQARAKATGYAMAASATADGKTALFEGGRTPTVGSPPHGNGPCARGSAGGSSAAEGGLGTTSGNNNASMVTGEDRVLDKSAASVSLIYAGVGEPSGWKNGTLSGGLRDSGSGGGYSLNASFGLSPSTLFHSNLHPPHSMAMRAGAGGGGGGVGAAIGSMSNGSYHDPRNHHLPQAHAHHQHPQQPSQLLRNFSFDTTCSPTDAALSLLRMAREGKSNGNGSGEGEGRPDSAGSDGSAAANLGLQPSLDLPTPCINLHSIELTTQDIVACANDFSWVSLPCIMKAELQHLQEQLRGTRRAAQRMEGQVRGELALLIFRLLSIVLDWLMPAVYVADPRVWLFYRKWCCDLYRVLCTDAALLEEFHRLLNQSDLAVSSTAADVSGLPSRQRGSARDMHRVGRAKARSVTRTPTLSPPRDPPSSPGSGMTQPQPQARLHLPGTSAAVSAAAADNGDYHDASAGFVALEGAAASTGGAARHRSVSCASPLMDNASAATGASIEDAFSFILPGSSLAVSVSRETPPVRPGVLNLLAQEEVDRRGEAIADMASLRAAQALLNDEGTVVPLPCPFLITRLVAATLRGIDADIAESLLWVAGQAPASDSADGAGVGSGVEDAAGGILVDALRSRSIKSGTPQSQRAAAVGPRGLREDGERRGTSGGGHAHDAEEDEGEIAVPGRHLSHAAHRTASGHRLPSHHHSRCVRHHRSISADARVGGGASSAAASYYTVDSEEDDAGYGDNWYGVLARRERSQLAPSPLLGPATANGSGRGAAAGAASASSVLPHAITRNPFSDLASTGGPQRLSLPPQPSEGPTLVHHHRFRYPSVHGYADVAELYLSTLDDAELVLSPHDPVYASLVLSTADLHLHDLRDTATAASLVNAYLVDVGEEHIQGPVWRELPAVVISDEGGGVAASPLNVAGDGAGSSSSARPAPGRGFSVTRAQQGNTQGPTSTTAAPSAAGVAAVAATAPTERRPPRPPQQQRPYVPMVIPSWNNEQEKEEFLATLQLLRQMQVFLAVEQTKLQHDVLES
ncbi:conserved hypothetical protein [Leishmania infantum JPCM5]|uniref:Uncharacterized protein n=2 Tax=Leishmania infantum TaxID=5671 RepID=A4HXV8_LEIIN|nr:conserved hypothetical protein [Leishmania infantum JPCM5]CAC9480693.1 hypothetical_protein_-_conserved [Leishmania infantum]CAM67137.2 conserved hypothetical protein [Leishmania infantum JPCM5]SUZ41010.1 hypothetical_protein_-_conserved [Leishmania infantum]|eukprot:XP_001464899.2 conserved hypothetical protein [Leishmania infantum JPCM5]